MLGKISFFILLIVFIALAIMFNWFGSRELAEKGVSSAEEAVERLQDTGDSVSQAIDTMKEKEEK